MKYAAYSEYKSSHVDWLGDVPSHWVVKAIKWESPVLRGASPRPIDDPIYFDDDGEYAWVRISDVTEAGTYLENTEQKLSDVGSRLSVKLQPGDLFLSIAGSVGKPCITRIKCCIHDGFVYFPRWKADPKFLYYLFASGEPYKGLGKMGTQLNLNTDTVGSIDIGLPADDEQQAIARFLDAKTAQIDALVAHKRQLIDKLKEKRSALIARTVTRGLPPAAAEAAGLEPIRDMKDSGVVWIGKIPTHWTCTKTAFFFSAGMGQTILKEELNDEGLPVYSATEGDHFFGRLIDPKLRLKRGDIVVPARGNSIGHVKLVEEESTTTQTTIYFKNRARRQIDSEYAFYFMKGLRHHLFEFDQTAIPQITVDQVLGNPMLVLPMNEQLAICKFLRVKEAEANGMLQTVELAITRLTEYRQALITSAVTGKIDVRELAP